MNDYEKWFKTNRYYVVNGVAYGGFLNHYGVPGQKHGVRRYQNKDGSLTPLGREHYGYGTQKGSFADRAKTAGAAFRKKFNEMRSNRRVNNAVSDTRNGKKRVRLSNLSDEELSRYTKRLNLENQLLSEIRKKTENATAIHNSKKNRVTLMSKYGPMLLDKAVSLMQTRMQEATKVQTAMINKQRDIEKSVKTEQQKGLNDIAKMKEGEEIKKRADERKKKEDEAKEKKDKKEQKREEKEQKKEQKQENKEQKKEQKQEEKEQKNQKPSDENSGNDSSKEQKNSERTDNDEAGLRFMRGIVNDPEFQTRYQKFEDAYKRQRQEENEQKNSGRTDNDEAGLRFMRGIVNDPEFQMRSQKSEDSYKQQRQEEKEQKRKSRQLDQERRRATKAMYKAPRTMEQIHREHLRTERKKEKMMQREARTRMSNLRSRLRNSNRGTQEFEQTWQTIQNMTMSMLNNNNRPS